MRLNTYFQIIYTWNYTLPEEKRTVGSIFYCVVKDLGLPHVACVFYLAKIGIERRMGIL